MRFAMDGYFEVGDNMVLVTLGTQDKKFYRLLDAVETAIQDGVITDVVVQAGFSSDYKSDKMKIFDLIPTSEFDRLIDKCDILITHGGAGSIITGLKHNKKIIAAPRLKKYNEHTNDHQLQLISNFKQSGYIIALDDFNKLSELIKKIDEFTPRKFVSNQKNFIRRVKNIIDKM